MYLYQNLICSEAAAANQARHELRKLLTHRDFLRRRPKCRLHWATHSIHTLRYKILGYNDDIDPPQNIPHAAGSGPYEFCSSAISPSIPDSATQGRYVMLLQYPLFRFSSFPRTCAKIYARRVPPFEVGLPSLASRIVTILEGGEFV